MILHKNSSSGITPDISLLYLRKSPGTLGVSEAQIILRILLSVVDDIAVVAEWAQDAPSIFDIAVESYRCHVNIIGGDAEHKIGFQEIVQVLADCL